MRASSLVWMLLLPLAAMTARADDAAAVAPAAAIVSQAELLARMNAHDTALVILDVRSAEEYAASHVSSAINLAHDRINADRPELAILRDKDVVVYCRTGRRSLLAIAALRVLGITRVSHLDGDFVAWQAMARPTQP